MQKIDVHTIINNNPGEGPILSLGQPEEFKKKFDELVASGVYSYKDILERVCKKDPKATAILEKQGDSYKAISYEEMMQISRYIGNAFYANNFCPEVTVDGKKVRFFGILMDNWKECLYIDIANNGIGAAGVPLFPETPDYLDYLVNEIPFESIAIQPDYAKYLIERTLAKKTRVIKNYILTGEADAETKKKGAELGIQFYMLNELIEKGKTLPDYNAPPDLDRPIYVVTTSGSTGYPKGIFTENKATLYFYLSLAETELNPNESIVANLSYSFGSMKVMAIIALYTGGKVIFFGSKPEKTFEVMRETNPTIGIFAPIIFHNAYTNVMQTINAIPSPKKEGLLQAIEGKIKWMKATKSINNPALDPYFADIKNRLFGKDIKKIFYVGASMREEVLWFFRAIACCPIQPVYGLSESGGLCLIGSPFASGSTIGRPLLGYQLKVLDIEEKGYTSKDKVGDKLMPRGELVIMSDTICRKYYGPAEKSKGLLTKDGWLRTNDIVVQNLEEGFFDIIGRTNNITKLSNEDFVNPEHLERLYEASKYVAQMYVRVSSERDYVVSVVFPKETEVKKWAETKGKAGDFAALCKDPELKKEIVTDLEIIADKHSLVLTEHMTHVYLTSKPFTRENGMLTFSFKLRREAIFKEYEKEILELYEP